MRRILLLLAALAASAGCATPGGGQMPNRVGAVNNATTIPCETGIALDNTTKFSATRLTLSVDTLSFQVSTGAGWTGSYGLQGSNDGTTWLDATLTTTPPAATGSAQTFSIDYEGGWSKAWARVKFVGASGATTASVCPVFKG